MLFAAICGTKTDITIEQVFPNLSKSAGVSASEKKLALEPGLDGFQAEVQTPALSKELNSIKHIIFPRANEDAGK